MTDISRFIGQLCSTDLAERRSAAERLAQMGAEAVRALVPLIGAVADSDEIVREWAISALESLKPDASQIPGLVDKLDDAESDRVYWAATLLGRSGPSAAAGVAALIRVLNDHPTQAVQEQAAWALGMIGTAAHSSLPALKRAASRPVARLGRLAKESIQKIQPE